MIAGSAVLALGSFLPWFTVGDTTVSGWSEFSGETRDGPILFVLAAVVGAFGIAMLAKGKILGLAIAGIVVAAFAFIASVVDYGDVRDLQDLFGVEAGIGLPLCVLGAGVATAGSIVATAKRRS